MTVTIMGIRWWPVYLGSRGFVLANSADPNRYVPRELLLGALEGPLEEEIRVGFTAALHELVEYERERRATWQRDAEYRAEQERIRMARMPYGPPFVVGAARNLYIYDARQRLKLSYRKIGYAWGISLERVRQICMKAERRVLATRCKIHPRAGLSRIQDHAGDAGLRDVWLSYGVPPDPRLDNFYSIKW